MYTRLSIAAAAFAVIAGPLSAQSFQRRAEISGGGYSDRGKCTVEVVVDGAAEIEIRGDSGTLRNLSGQPAQWRRFQCTGVLPANPAEFRFAGLDGRGRQELVRDPRNGGAAVVRIEDPEGGAQGYTFDITWAGATAVAPPGGQPRAGQSFQRRAEITGGGYSDRGKCTVEVFVDGAAEIEIRGDSGTVRNLAGQPAEWRRFQCTGAMPANPAEFRFAGVDGRGRQQLVRDPRNGGVAVVRIEDPESGAQVYTFELTWGGGGAPPPAVQDRGRPDQRENRPDPSQWDQRGRYGDRDRVVNRRYTSDQAIRMCQDNVRQQANSRFRTSNIIFQRTAIDDNPGRNDWVMGTFSIRRGYRGQETHRFACSVDFDNGRVRSAQIDPQDGGRGAQGNQGGNQAIQNCQRAVEQRLGRDGYDRVDFRSINVDDRPGRNDWIVGNARADGRDGGAAFSFSCSVDLNDGDIRSVDVTRR